MEVTVKNIILYDELGNVSGFVEFKIHRDQTDIKVRHNLGVGDYSLSVVAGKVIRDFELTGETFEFRGRVDVSKEIFVCIKSKGKTLASGIINQGSLAVARDDAKTLAVKELDEAIRAVCVTIDENGKGQCETCPYREHFFGHAMTCDDEVVV